VNCVKSLSDVERSGVLVNAASALRTQFRKTTASEKERFSGEDFATVSGIVNFMIDVDPSNGHGWYHAGEIKRWLNKGDKLSEGYLRSHEDFFRYLEAIRGLPEGEKDGRAASCYARANGYCGERTAWIDHLIANDFCRVAVHAVDRSVRRAKLRKALEFANGALKFYQDGFDDATQHTATLLLIGNIERELRDGEDAGSPPCPPS
jgi:hypothetical protein